MLHHHFRLFWFLPATILHIALVGFAQEKNFDFSGLEKVALKELKETNTPGAAIAIVSGDKVLFSKGLGVANIETGAPMQAEMLFQIGSMTKMFTATLLVMLTEEGKLDLNTPIGNYVKGLSPKLAQITTHQLLSQTSGLKDEPADYGLHDESALADYVHSWKNDYALLSPGKVFSYSNPGFTLAGLLIETVGGKFYAEQMRERLFAVLGMSRTTFHPTVAMTYPLAVGHNSRGKAKPVLVRPFADDARHWPAGYMFSNVNEIARFAMAFMNDGYLDAKQVLSSSVIAKLVAPYVEVPNIFENAQYGYGLFVENERGVRTVWHDGFMPGFSCVLKMVSAQRFAVTIFANIEGVQFNKTINKALDLILPPKAKTAASPKPALPMSTAEMANCVGSYSNRWTMELFVREGKLFLRRFGAELPVTKIGDQRFSITPEGASEAQEFLLAPGADGKPEYLHMFLWAFKN